MKNNINKIVKQMKEDQKKPTANDVVISSLFENGTTALVYELMKRLGVPVEGKTFKETLIEATDKLKAVPYIQYPTSFSTVDILPVLYSEETMKVYILLGRKPNQTQYQLIGGFRDPGETGAEAAKRELKEETLFDIDISRLEFKKDMYIDDTRYKDSCHKITTQLFFAHVDYDQMIEFSHGDDIAETNWFDYQELISGEWKEVVRSVHHNLFQEVISLIEIP